MNNLKHTLDSKLNLFIERTVAISPEVIWKAWTTPELLMP